MKNIDHFITTLFELDAIKTWSFIVTIFGDLDRDCLLGKDLRELMSPLGIRPEATRVALHRLKKDGWIVSKKSGREVIYQLSEQGRSDTNTVYDDIYGQALKYPDGWQFLLLEDAHDDLDNELPSIRINRNLALVPRPYGQNLNSTIEIQIAQDEIPTWFQHRLLSRETLLLSETLLGYIHMYKGIEREATQLQKVLIRLLILHHWRKIALRPACWAHIALLPKGSVASLQKAATDFLRYG